MSSFTPFTISLHLQTTLIDFLSSDLQLLPLLLYLGYLILNLILSRGSTYLTSDIHTSYLGYCWLFVHRTALIAIVAFLEPQNLILQIEQLELVSTANHSMNNVGTYRAFKSSPLPFNCDRDYTRSS
ncbi:hypothetical protein ACFX2I_023558 [Malus domestica]